MLFFFFCVRAHALIKGIHGFCHLALEAKLNRLGCLVDLLLHRVVVLFRKPPQYIVAGVPFQRRPADAEADAEEFTGGQCSLYGNKSLVAPGAAPVFTRTWPKGMSISSWITMRSSDLT